MESGRQIIFILTESDRLSKVPKLIKEVNFATKTPFGVKRKSTKFQPSNLCGVEDKCSEVGLLLWYNLNQLITHP